MAKQTVDFTFQNHGSIALLIPHTDAARTWVAENLPEDRLTLGDAVAIEPRYVVDILTGLINDGLEGQGRDLRAGGF